MDANTPDGRYDHTKPWVPGVEPQPLKPRWQYLGPFSSNEERIAQQAIQSAVLPGAELAAMVRCPIPQVELFPPRFGYDRTQPSIDAVIDVDRRYVDPRISWYSGHEAGYQGASRNSLGSV